MIFWAFTLAADMMDGSTEAEYKNRRRNEMVGNEYIWFEWKKWVCVIGRRGGGVFYMRVLRGAKLICEEGKMLITQI